MKDPALILSRIRAKILWIRNTASTVGNVCRGLCQAAVSHPERNRYCNLYPYDSHRIVLATTASKVSVPVEFR